MLAQFLFLVVTFISNFTHKINKRYFCETCYLLKVRYLNNSVKKKKQSLL